MVIFIVRLAKQTAQRFDLSCNYGSNLHNCGVALLYICVGAYLCIYKCLEIFPYCISFDISACICSEVHRELRLHLAQPVLSDGGRAP